MAIKLRANEQFITKADFHWSCYLRPFFIGFFATPLGVLFLNSGSNLKMSFAINFGYLLLATGPFLMAKKLLENKLKTFVITNQRIFLQEGIIARATKEIPLKKINDIGMRQGIAQRLLGSGNVVILTGNDLPVVLLDIDKPEEFRAHASEMLAKAA